MKLSELFAGAAAGVGPMRESHNLCREMYVSTFSRVSKSVVFVADS